MANVSVTITKAGRCDYYGAPLVVGQVYSTSFDEARSLWQSGFASVADETVFDNDSLPGDASPVKSFKFPGFKPCLLPSLAANSTASRSNGVVTVSATGHGITTGTTYVGFRFYFPGCASLLAGWYDSILSVADANTVTFSAPGSDFGSQSINAAAAWTTTTDVISLTIPAGTLKDQSRVSVRCLRGGSTDAGLKTLTIRFGTAAVCTNALGAGPFSDMPLSFRCFGLNAQRSVSYADGTAGGAFVSSTMSVAQDNDLTIRGTCAAASEFFVVFGANVEVTQ